jgi:hypothetical protein
MKVLLRLAGRIGNLPEQWKLVEMPIAPHPTLTIWLESEIEGDRNPSFVVVDEVWVDLKTQSIHANCTAESEDYWHEWGDGEIQQWFDDFGFLSFEMPKAKELLNSK